MILNTRCILSIVFLFHNIAIGFAFTPEENAKLSQIRELTKDILQKDFMKTDGYLIRWLRTKNMDVGAAHQMLKKAVEWRKANQIDSILNDAADEGGKKQSFTLVQGHDKKSRPFAIIEFKELGIRKFTVAGQGDKYKRAWYRIYETLEENIFKTNNKSEISQGVYVTNMQDYNIREHFCLQCVSIYTDLLVTYEKYYPMLVGKSIVVNAPRTFTALVEVLKPFMSPATRDIYTIYGVDKAEWQKDLFQVIPENQIPTKYGGSRKL